MAHVAKASVFPEAGILQYYHAPEMRMWEARVWAQYVHRDHFIVKYDQSCISSFVSS